MGHGKFDPVVPFYLGRTTLEGLKKLGLDPTFREYKSDHTIPNDCLQDVLEWLNEKN